MSVIKAKQIEGVLDTESDQTVVSTKRFTKPQSFLGGRSVLTIYQDYLYWCKQEGVLEQAGNSRLTMENGRLVTEMFDGKIWVENGK